MNVLFGDATTTMPTPTTQAERGSLMGRESPVPSLDIRRQQTQFGPENAIPGLDIEPPNIGTNSNGKRGRDGDANRSEGIGGWISNMVSRNRNSGAKGSSSQYRRLEQQEE